jgi:hypothetical protein
MEETAPDIESSCEYIEQEVDKLIATNKGWSSSLGFGRGVTTIDCKELVA